MRDYFKFRSEYAEVIGAAPKNLQLPLYQAVVRYSLEGQEPEFSGVQALAWAQLLPALKADRAHYLAGCKGGCPQGTKKPSMAGNKNAQKQNQNADLVMKKQNQNGHLVTEKQNQNKPQDDLFNNIVKDSLYISRNTAISHNTADNKQAIITASINNMGAQPAKKSTAFVKPTAEQLQAYVTEKQLNVNVEQFLDHYNSNGWMVGRTHMKDWKAAARNWARQGFRYNDKNNRNNGTSTIAENYNGAAVRVMLRQAERERDAADGAPGR